MQKTSLKICAVVGVMGIFGAFIRWLQILNTFDDVTGLVTRNSSISYVLLVFMLVFVAVLYVMLRRFMNMDMPSDYNEAITQKHNYYGYVAYAIGILMALGGLLTLITAVSQFATNHDPNAEKPIFDIFAGLFSFAAAVSMIYYIREAGKPAKNGKLPTGAYSSTVITVYVCFLLIATYKYIATDPEIWHYAFRILAVASMALALYYLTGFSYNKPLPRKSVYFGLLSVFLGFITMFDSYPLGYGLINLAISLFLLVTSGLTLSKFKNSQVDSDSTKE